MVLDCWPLWIQYFYTTWYSCIPSLSWCPLTLWNLHHLLGSSPMTSDLGVGGCGILCMWITYHHVQGKCLKAWNFLHVLCFAWTLYYLWWARCGEFLCDSCELSGLLVVRYFMNACACRYSQQVIQDSKAYG